MRTFPGIARATPPHDDMRVIAGEETRQPISLQMEQAAAQFPGFRGKLRSFDFRFSRFAYPR
ncbi:MULTISPECIES: hypothetical protein [unclassified Mesorhizobium]|uniref:hypothetical protein n=1 Tax=unclassified Mesorhizobium TaxID=325217 RepID=UPI001140D86F|nr:MULTISPECIES: hypothetical protein [unclassified Mesorhizobium]MDG4909033.1 hypothetical protein [Mesorhizobium sp. WSM4898]